MNCEIARQMTETNDPALAQHQLSCPSCIVGAHARYYEAPPALEQKIRASLRREAAPALSLIHISTGCPLGPVDPLVGLFTMARA